MKRISGLALVPEIACSNIEITREFYTQVLGFNVRYERPAEKFMYFERQGAELMAIQHMEQNWASPDTGSLLGQGVHFQIMVSKLDPLYHKCDEEGATIMLPREEVWYRAGNEYVGQLQFAISDPDGYLLRFAEDVGVKREPPLNVRVVR